VHAVSIAANLYNSSLPSYRMLACCNSSLPCALGQACLVRVQACGGPKEIKNGAGVGDDRVSQHSSWGVLQQCNAAPCWCDVVVDDDVSFDHPLA